MSGFWIILGAAVLSTLGADESTRPWEERILNERQVIKSGSLRLQSELIYVSQNNRKLSTRYIVRFEGMKLLLDKSVTHGSDKVEQRMVFCRRGDVFNHYTSTIYQEGQATPLDFVSVTDYAKLKGPLSKIDSVQKSGGLLPDPVALGLLPSSFGSLGAFRRDEMLRRGDVESSSVDVGDFHGAPCKILRYQLKNGSAIRVSLQEDGSLLNVLAVEWAYGLDGAKFVDRVENRNKRYETATGPVLYPDLCTFTQRQNGIVVRSEDLSIEVVSWNAPLDPESFTLTGMKLPQGTLVVQNPKQGVGPQIWDGAKISAKPAPPLPAP